MTHSMKSSTAIAACAYGAVIWGVVLCGGTLAAQGAGLRGAAPGPAIGRGAVPEDGAITPAEIQRMFDAYALLQAQAQLAVTDDQYARFLTRFRTLLDLRRKALNEHTRIVADLRRLLMEGQADESQLKERIQALEDADTRSRADIKKAVDAIDQVLDVRQQARFRVFEEQMERRKLELVTRARLATRPKPQP
jgi:hypothetical protein